VDNRERGSPIIQDAKFSLPGRASGRIALTFLGTLIVVPDWGLTSH